ncbi:phosphoesterase PA-phosphatase related protein [Thalassoporum mexicanum PCC 7367]|nr:phosphoesterase PA-phosphatase related protein [Pseudanabaena sp. PCC 7367]
MRSPQTSEYQEPESPSLQSLPRSRTKSESGSLLNRIARNFAALVNLVGRWQLIACVAIALALTQLSLLILQNPLLPAELEFMQWFQQAIPPAIGNIWGKIFFACDAEVSATVVVISILVLSWRKLWHEAFFIAIAAAGAIGMNDLLFKPFFARERPPLFDDPTISGYAFPSGHAFGNLMLYFFLAYLLSAHFPKLTNYFYGAAIVFIASMGLGSMYLGVHWLTDVIAGYGVGFIWLTICLTLLKLSKRKFPSPRLPWQN